MTKKFSKIDNQTLSIFDYLNRIKTDSAAVKPSTTGTMACVERLRAAIRDAIKNSHLSIHQVAGEMSHLLDETVTADMIYSWTRQSDEANGRPVRHIPAQYMPAFCKATGDTTVIGIMGELVGLFVLPGPDALRSEIAKADEAIRVAKDRQQRRKILLQELENQR